MHSDVDTRQKLTVDQVAWAFEQIDQGVPLKAIALDLDVHPTTLSRRLRLAEELGFEAFENRRWWGRKQTDN